MTPRSAFPSALLMPPGGDYSDPTPGSASPSVQPNDRHCAQWCLRVVHARNASTRIVAQNRFIAMARRPTRRQRMTGAMFDIVVEYERG